MKILKQIWTFITSLFKDNGDKNVINASTTVYPVHNLTLIDRLTLSEINEFRLTLNINELIPDDFLNAVAYSHSIYMANNQKATHDKFNKRVTDISTHFSEKGRVVIGENVGYGYKTTENLVKAWRDSKTHREVLKGHFTHIGISNVADSKGKIYTTTIFLLIK